MFRSAVARWTTVLSVIVIVGFASPVGVVSQEATPVPDEDRDRIIHPRDTPVSDFDPLPCPLWPQSDPAISSWEMSEFMQWPSIIMVEYEPGASTEGDDGALGAPLVGLTFIQSGEFVITATAPMAVYKWKSGGTPEIIAKGEEFTAEAGDYFVTGPENPGMRNDGDTPATYQYAVMNPEDPLVIDRCASLG